MRVLLLSFPLIVSNLSLSTAMYQEDVGKFDFLLSTTGHGAVRTLHYDNDNLLLTSSSSSCYVAARKVDSGDLLWRKNVCGTTNRPATVNSVLLEASGVLVTLATTTTNENTKHVLRGWNTLDGGLAWDYVLPNEEMDIQFAGADTMVVVTVGSDRTIVLDGTTGIEAAEAEVPEIKEASFGMPYTEPTECPDLGVSVQTTEGSVQVISKTNSEILASVPGNLFWIFRCSPESMQIMASCSRHGTTSVLSYSQKGQQQLHWTAQEGWGHVSAGLILDAPNRDLRGPASEDLLTFQARLQSQWNSMASTFSTDHRNQIFGFGKVAVLLSSTYNRVWGLDTLMAGTPRYQIDLPVTGGVHRLVHGSVQGSGHTRHVVALSYNNEDPTMQWVCWDGTTGQVKNQGDVSLPAGIVQQIVPVASTTDDKCRQGALVLMEDGTVVPVNADSENVLSDERTLYAHVVDRATARIRSLAVEKTTRLVGTAMFPDETILTIAYPPREEVVQSPCTVLGDNSLLLKYLNPHLMVVVTTAKPSEDEDDFLGPPKSSQPRKPLGVVPPEEITPNLFINVVDSVAGRVLYRASHGNAKGPVVVTLSENWIFYSFANTKTHKTELGVLSLYEGKIVKDGLTAFTTPEQSTVFSSLDAPDPIVLAKTYLIPQAATALGVTATKGGISGRRLLVAGVNGRIDAIDRKVLEPRRPLGKLKDEEKKEGLAQYHEVVPMVPPMALSYNRTVKGVTTILSAPTDLESQSLVLAFGGPDVFFVRTSPSRGFDLLPDSFNKVLILLVVVAMAAIYLVLQRVVAKKVIDQGWV